MNIFGFDIWFWIRNICVLKLVWDGKNWHSFLARFGLKMAQSLFLGSMVSNGWRLIDQKYSQITNMVLTFLQRSLFQLWKIRSFGEGMQRKERV